jgi:hypothetical protein
MSKALSDLFAISSALNTAICIWTLQQHGDPAIVVSACSGGVAALSALTAISVSFSDAAAEILKRGADSNNDAKLEQKAQKRGLSEIAL